jgi:hypothetical protein
MTKANLNEIALKNYKVSGALESNQIFTFKVQAENDRVARSAIYYRFEEINQSRRTQKLPSHKVASMIVTEIGVSA